MLWDIFCKVIDNFGDIGVCWRLSRDMASRGHEVRLWVDDDSALRWMAPHVNAHGHGEPGVTVQHWPADEATMPEVDPGDVVIEAFGCNPPDGFVARMQRPAPPRWVNLEYLSAEGYVERSHGLSSPVWSGPGYGLKKRFFYPGFTSRTGGLLREPPLLLKRDAFAGSAAERERWLSSLGVSHQPQERLVTLFCYAQSPVSLFLDALSQSNVPCHVLLTPGHATEQAMAWQPPLGSTLRLSRLSALPQPEFDRLLWCTPTSSRPSWTCGCMTGRRLCVSRSRPYGAPSTDWQHQMNLPGPCAPFGLRLTGPIGKQPAPDRADLWPRKQTL